MNEPSEEYYTFMDCEYLGGDLSILENGFSADVLVRKDAIEVVNRGSGEVHSWAKDLIVSVRYAHTLVDHGRQARGDPTTWMDMECLSLLEEEGMDRMHSAKMLVADRSGVWAALFDIRLGFPNEYEARRFVKSVHHRMGLSSVIP